MPRIGTTEGEEEKKSWRKVQEDRHCSPLLVLVQIETEFVDAPLRMDESLRTPSFGMSLSRTRKWARC
jgi:hypothetical protein